MLTVIIILRSFQPVTELTVLYRQEYDCNFKLEKGKETFDVFPTFMHENSTKTSVHVFKCETKKNSRSIGEIRRII